MKRKGIDKALGFSIAFAIILTATISLVLYVKYPELFITRPNATIKGKILDYNFITQKYSIQLDNGTVKSYSTWMSRSNLVIGQTYLLELEYQNWPREYVIINAIEIRD